MKYLIIIIMACSLYPQSTMTGWYRAVDMDSTYGDTVYHNTFYSFIEDDLDYLWYNYQTDRIQYRKTFDDKVGVMLIIQSPYQLKIYKWLRAKGYNPMESVRRTNAFADKEHEKFEKRINKIMND